MIIELSFSSICVILMIYKPFWKPERNSVLKEFNPLSSYLKYVFFNLIFKLRRAMKNVELARPRNYDDEKGTD